MQLFKILFLVWITVVFSEDEVDDDEYPQKSDSSYRLPKSIMPIRYTLTIEPTLETNLDLPPFNGSVVMEIKSMLNTTSITLHAKKLNINESTISITDSLGTNIKFTNTTINKRKQFYKINLEEELQKGKKYNITIGSFSGVLNDDNVGFYLGKYKNVQGQQRNIAVTEFEPAHARKAFPCFDEPHLKATFIINVVRPEGYISVSNEELVSTVDLGDGRFQDVFKETVSMSTYIVAFAVGELKATEQVGRFRVLAQPKAIDDGRGNYILLEAPPLLEALENFTGINYALNKIDLLAIPDEYYMAGAMENWGLVTFKEEHLLYSNTSSTTQDLQRCTTYTAHELAHQWFGNLVTQAWWKYMWLGEGFATYFQYHIADIVKPSWRLKEQYVVEHFQLALKNDADSDTEPMNFEPEYYTGIPSAWISYYKSCAVIRMAEHFLTHSVFQNGLQIYLQENSFRNAKPSQLYSAFQKALNQSQVAHELLGDFTVADILSNWDASLGYPLVTASRNYENGTLTLTQKPYRNSGLSENGSIWKIPITYVFELNSTQTFTETKTDLWFTEPETIVDKDFPTDGWLLINKQQTGYYRVNYDITNWQRIINFLTTGDFKSIHPVNRAQLINDAFSQAASEDLPYDIPLNLSKYLIRETDLIPLTTFVQTVDELDALLSGSKEYSIFQIYVKSLLSGAVQHLGFEEKPSDTHVDKLNRMNVLKWICGYGDSECRNVGLEKLRLWAAGDSGPTLSPDLESALLCGAMQIATFDDWKFLLELYYSTEDTYQKTRYMKALGCTQDREILNFFFNLISGKNETIADSDRRDAVESITKTSTTGFSATLEYLTNNTIDLGTEYKYEVRAYIGERIMNADQLKQVIDLSKISGNNYRMAEFIGKSNIRKFHGRGPEILKWLVDYSKTNIDNDNVIER